MSGQRTRDTQPELALRRELHSLGLRYFVHREPVPGLRRTADILFPRLRLAVFVDGCYWHRCPLHATAPRTNAHWWAAKLERNVERDADTNLRLAEAGWTVLRFWEHEDSVDSAHQVVRTATELRLALTGDPASLDNQML